MSSKLSPACSAVEVCWPVCLIEEPDSGFYYTDLGIKYVTDAAGQVFPTKLLEKSRYVKNCLCLTGPASGIIASKPIRDDIYNHFPFENTLNILPNRIKSYFTLKSVKQIDERTLEDYVSDPYKDQWILLRALQFDNEVYLDQITHHTLKYNSNPLAKFVFHGYMTDFKGISYEDVLLSLISAKGHEVSKDQFITNIKTYSHFYQIVI